MYILTDYYNVIIQVQGTREGCLSLSYLIPLEASYQLKQETKECFCCRSIYFETQWPILASYRICVSGSMHCYFLCRQSVPKHDVCGGHTCVAIVCFHNQLSACRIWFTDEMVQPQCRPIVDIVSPFSDQHLVPCSHLWPVVPLVTLFIFIVLVQWPVS